MTPGKAFYKKLKENKEDFKFILQEVFEIFQPIPIMKH